MATKFLEPSGDADFAVTGVNGFWSAISGAPAVVTDFVHGSHVKSIQCRPNNSDALGTGASTIANAGGRFSMYIYLVALPNATSTIWQAKTNGDIGKWTLRLTSAGVLQLWNATTAQIGTNGSTLSTGVWYRISLAFVTTSTVANEFRLFKDGVLDISVTNATITITGAGYLLIGNNAGNATLDLRFSDHYLDDSSSLVDTGNIWVTAKRPIANGTTNGFTTQVGSGGSGYGTGHSPQVNERPLSVTDGWSIVGSGSAVTEEYNIENTSTGDIDISSATIVDYLGWASAKSLLSESGSIIVNGVSSIISLSTTTTLFKKIAGSSSYPAGTGTDIGIVTTTALTTVSLFECGVVVAYIPAVPAASNPNFLRWFSLYRRN